MVNSSENSLLTLVTSSFMCAGRWEINKQDENSTSSSMGIFFVIGSYFVFTCKGSIFYRNHERGEIFLHY
jgi:hypothetical protein